MIVTFVSECHKNSLKLTRKVLDAYAHRIGQRTWQTTITEQGLQAVRERLSKTARKSTSVACHRIHGTRRSELLWIVGNRTPFDLSGNVAVNYTTRDILKIDDENDWRFLELLQSMVAVAALFHDFGKAWDPFQEALQSKPDGKFIPLDPWRHEWVSALLFIAYVDGREDGVWLDELAAIGEVSSEDASMLSLQTIKRAAATLEKFAPINEWQTTWLVRSIVWLIVSHHRIPYQYGLSTSGGEEGLIKQINQAWGYVKSTAEPFNLDRHWRFSSGLPFMSKGWRSSAARWGRKLKVASDHSSLSEAEQCQRLLLTLGRTALMLGDHNYSSKEESPHWRTEYLPFANTYSKDQTPITATSKKKRDMRQRLDEHLVEVTNESVRAVRLIPALEHASLKVQDNRPLRKPSKDARFRWQDKAVEKLKVWQSEKGSEHMGFFAVNLASTGTGKTFANAKIMNAISPKGLRYTLALGLRTLTLQTGDEYKSKLRLDPTELAILVGSKAVRILHDQRTTKAVSLLDSLDQFDGFGSESSEDLDWNWDFLDEDMIPDDAVSTIVSTPKQRQILKCPVLVCTIDHIMPAVENVRGGQHILPLLRLVSSDLVIDEVDDFDHLDMPAISRLVHLTGMLGRRVMISSATIPPAIANGLFHSYRSGYSQFAKLRNRQPRIAGFWTDEFGSAVHQSDSQDAFSEQHDTFVAKRCAKLAAIDPPVRSAKVFAIEQKDLEKVDAEARQSLWFSAMTNAAIDLHRRHNNSDEETGKSFSIGVIRMANVEPCIQLSRHLLTCELPDDVDVKVMTYHARQVMLLRSQQERYLDSLLNRKQGRTPSSDSIVRHHLSRSPKSHVLFIVVASPVVEVGRDHDYDWAVIEPSSIRSVIQMAGRVRRHRSYPDVDNGPNLSVASLNYRAFVRGEKIAFYRPGFEGGDKSSGGGIVLRSKSLFDLVDVASLQKRVDSSPRIHCPQTLTPESNLSHLEHHVLRRIFEDESIGPTGVKAWTSGSLYLTQACQIASPFRASTGDSPFKLFVDSDDNIYFCEVDPRTEKLHYPTPTKTARVGVFDLPPDERSRIWNTVDVISQVRYQQDQLGRSRFYVCDTFCDIRLWDPSGQKQFRWCAELGALS